MRDAEKLMQEIRMQLNTLQALSRYLESQENWSEEDMTYCRSTVRRVARELIHVSRGPLGAAEVYRVQVQKLNL